MTKLPFLAMALAITSCNAVQGPAAVDLTGAVLTQYNFRGVPQNEEGAVQADVNVALPTSSEGTLELNVWTNWDGHNDTGPAVLPDGNGGKMSEIDLVGGWSKDFESVSFSTGLISYNFPNNVGGSTTEVYAGFGWDVFDLSPSVTLYWDFDSVDGAYLNGSISRGFELSEDTSAELGLGLGFTDGDHALAYYGVDESGLADLLVSASVSHAYDENTTLGGFLSVSSIIDSDLEEALDAAKFDSENVWLGASIGWSF